MLICIQISISYPSSCFNTRRALKGIQGLDSAFKLVSYCSHRTHDIVEGQSVNTLPGVLQGVSVELRPRASASSPIFS